MTRRSMLAQSALFALQEGRLNKCIEMIGEQTRSGQVSGAMLSVRHKGTVLQRAFRQGQDGRCRFPYRIHHEANDSNGSDDLN